MREREREREMESMGVYSNLFAGGGKNKISKRNSRKNTEFLGETIPLLGDI